jgi:hypothetical protein
MTHKNIVRYFQAWVEGPGIRDDAIDEEEVEDDNNLLKAVDSEEDDEFDSDEEEDVSAAVDDDDDDDDDDDGDEKADDDASADQGGSWWVNSPNETELPMQMRERVIRQTSADSTSKGTKRQSNTDSFSSASSEASVDWSDEASSSRRGDENNEDTTFSTYAFGQSKKLHTQSMENLLEHENNYGFQVGKKLLGSEIFRFRSAAILDADKLSSVLS